MKTPLFLYFLLFASLFSCNKNSLPSNTVGTPVYYFEGTINNISQKIQAGNDSMYMYTNATTNAANEKTLQGWFANQINANSEPNLMFELVNYKPNGSNTADIEIQNLHNFYSFSLDSVITFDTTLQFTFAPLDTNLTGTFLWKADDGTTANSKYFTHTFATAGMHTITFFYTSNQGCSTDSISNNINTNVNNNCNVQFKTITNASIDSVSVIATTGFNNYLWAWGDTITTQSATNTSSHTYFDSLNHTITLIATQSTCSSTFKVKVNPMFNNQCLASFNYTTQQIINTHSQNNTNKNSFVITWKNAGSTYKSYKTNSSSNQSNTLILSTNKTSLFNSKTVTIDGTSNCWLYNVSNNADSIKLNSTKLNFALGL